MEVIASFGFEYFKPKIIAKEIHSKDIEDCLETPEAKLIKGKGYKLVASAVITHFFVRAEIIKS